MSMPVHQHPDQTRVPITGPSELIAAIPAMLGFHPEASLVAVLLRDTRVVCTMRVDLDSDRTAVTDTVVNAAANGEAEHVLVAIYAAGDTGTWQPYAQQVTAALTSAGLWVGEVLLVQPDRYWSLLCHDPACCPPEGRPLPAGTTPLESEQVARGALAVAPSRQVLAQRYSPRPDLAPSEAAYRAASTILDQPLSARCRQALADLRLLTTAAQPPVSVDAGPLDLARAELALLLGDTTVRDHLLGTLATGPDDPAAVEALTQTAITALPPLRPAVATTAAVAQAAVAGSPVAIWALLDLAEDEYLARLLREAVTSGFTPGQIRGVLASAMPDIQQRVTSN